MLRRYGLLKGAVGAVGASLFLAASAAGATITVNNTAHTAADDGTCTLREAMTSAATNTASGAMANECAAGQAAPTRDLISFSIAGAGPHVFAPTTTYAVITERLEIDGSEGGAGPNIEIDGSGVTFPAFFVETTGAGSFIHDIAVYDVGSDGLRSRGADVTFQRVYAGLDVAGTAHGNAGDGIEISGDGNSVLDSVSSDNAGSGINVTPDAFAAAGGANTTIAGNRIGANLAGGGAVGNGGDGVTIAPNANGDADGTVIGGTDDPTPGGVCDGDCNVIVANGGDGIDVTANVPLTGFQIRSNHVGTGVAGLADVGNAGSGLHLSGPIASAVVRSNLIAGNGSSTNDNGIEMFPGTGAVGAPTDTTIAGNRIGVDRQGDDPLPNDGRGIQIAATVTANTGAITGTMIGGTADPTPGGACDGDCNVISGNGLDGISLFRSSGGLITGTQILGNHIGADAAGTGDDGNTQWGITLGGVSGTTIGSQAAPNVISGNNLSGIHINENPGGGNTVQANRIGTTSDGTGALGNSNSGVDVGTSGSGVTVGGTAAGTANTIANNGDDGVNVQGFGPPYPAVPILGNSIRSNGDLGIDLMIDGITGGGVTPNDGLGDPDTGGNGLQNFPVLGTVAVVGGSTYVVGSLDTLASTTYRIEVFANQVPDATNGEGAELAGSFNVTTDGTGHADFAGSFPGTVAAGKSTTATATRLDGSGNPLETSEFAANLAEGCDQTGTAGDDVLGGTAAAEVLCGLGGNDQIEGGGGNDVIAGGDGADRTVYASAASAVVVDLPNGTATGGAGSDLLVDVENAGGSPFADQITAIAGGSSLLGAGGTDTLTGGAGADTLEGDEGNDALTGAEGDDTLTGGGGDDSGTGGAGNDSMFGAGGNDSLTGDGGNDRVDGDDGNDLLLGSAGADTVSGFGGIDTASGGDGNDSLFGAAGNDALTGDGGNDTVDGDDGDDTLAGSGGADQVFGRGGNDVETGDDGDDTVAGNGGNDTTDGGAGNDTMTGDDGDDALAAVDGDDTVSGGAGKDAVDGGAGIDQVSGDDGDDALTGGGGADNLLGGAGTDTASGGDDNDTLDGGTGVSSSLDGGPGNDTVTGAEGADAIDGGDGDDTLNGLDGDDTLDGGIGNDTLDGGSGNDGADGEDGDDTVFGQSGDDDVTGGGGDDTVKTHGGRDGAEGGSGADSVRGGGGDKDQVRGQGGKDAVKGGGGDKDDVRGGGGKDKLDGGGGKKDECDGGGGKDEKPAPGCETKKSIP